MAPRTVCACHSNFAAIASIVAPSGRLSISISCTCLLSARIAGGFGGTGLVLLVLGLFNFFRIDAEGVENSPRGVQGHLAVVLVVPPNRVVARGAHFGVDWEDVSCQTRDPCVTKRRS
jgi:hypothetical protein